MRETAATEGTLVVAATLSTSASGLNSVTVGVAILAEGARSVAAHTSGSAAAHASCPTVVCR
jgi:hypothetical protein